MTSPRIRTTILYDDICAEHDPGPHVECPERILLPHQAFTTGMAEYTLVAPEAATREDLERIHTASYITRVEEMCNRGGGRLDPDTTASADTMRAALKAAGAGLTAIRMVEASPESNPFCLIRPPGHHALQNHAMGFCFFNNIAISAAHLMAVKRADKILIADFDVHHGNGTQDAFYSDPRVHFLSSHRSPFYPGTGSEHEQGEGEGIGTTTNLPLRFGTPPDSQVSRLVDTLGDIAATFQPQWVLASAGFDAYAGDPLGGLGWEEEHYHVVGRRLGEVARDHAKGRLISFLEGGYAVGKLADLIHSYLSGVEEGRQNS